MRRIEIEGPNASTVVVLATVQGLLSEADEVERAIRAAEPQVVGLQLDPEGVSEVPQWVAVEPDTPEDAAYLAGLAAFGDVALPPPDLRRAYDVGSELGIDVVGIDVPEFDWVDEFTRRISALDLMRRGLRMRRGKRRMARASSPEDYAATWDRRANTGPYAELEAWREKRMAERIAALAEDRGSALVVLEAARCEGVLRALEGSGFSSK